MTYLDTHSAVWLADADRNVFEARSRRAIESDDLFISPMVVLELQLLYEKKRITAQPSEVVADLALAGVRICDYPFGLVIETAVREAWTRDPFDRMITAHARARNASLVTHDLKIRENYKLAVW